MNFALILFVLLVVTGVLYAVDVAKFRKLRAKDAKEPLWVEWGASFFPVILIVFVLRSFLFEPFKIPSGSMIPTLLVGDFILVNKFTYGIRLPVINKKVIDINSPQRGDVMVFRYPEDPSLDYIKRVVGLPGDTVAYQNKKLIINGQPVPTQKAGDYLHPERLYYSEQFQEKLGDVDHRALNDADAPALRVNGRKVSNGWANLETLWMGIGDSLYGFRVYPIQPLIDIMRRNLWMRRFDFDPEAVVRLCWAGVRPINKNAPVRYFRADEGGVSHFKYLRDNTLLTWMHTRLFLGFLLRLPRLLLRRVGS